MNKIRQISRDYKETKYYCKKHKINIRRFLKKYRNKLYRRLNKKIIEKELKE